MNVASDLADLEQTLLHLRIALARNIQPCTDNEHRALSMRTQARLEAASVHLMNAAGTLGKLAMECVHATSK